MSERPVAIISMPSPNHSARPIGVAIDCVVLHADAGRTDEGTLNWITSPASKVSYGYFIGRDGRVYQCVADSRRAWHAGASSFEGRKHCNDYSIGVAWANDQRGEPFTDVAIAAGVELVARLCVKHNIPVRRIVTHEAVATPPGRKHDPGPLFPLRSFLADVAERIAHNPSGEAA